MFVKVVKNTGKNLNNYLGQKKVRSREKKHSIKIKSKE
jgi:hypothetical protein